MRLLKKQAQSNLTEEEKEKLRHLEEMWKNLKDSELNELKMLDSLKAKLRDGLPLNNKDSTV